jgi:methylated-DNA-protein-cysteine methyltransferase related protein
MPSWDPVYNLVKKIPRGRVTTYGALAKALRLRGGARVAGYAMAGCPGGKGIPWHRVIGAGGRLLIREPHASLQRRLLETEGVAVGDGKRVNMKEYGWVPIKVQTKSKARAQRRRKRRIVRRANQRSQKG